MWPQGVRGPRLPRPTRGPARCAYPGSTQALRLGGQALRHLAAAGGQVEDGGGRHVGRLHVVRVVEAALAAGAAGAAAAAPTAQAAAAGRVAAGGAAAGAAVFAEPLRWGDRAGVTRVPAAPGSLHPRLPPALRADTHRTGGSGPLACPPPPRDTGHVRRTGAPSAQGSTARGSGTGCRRWWGPTGHPAPGRSLSPGRAHCPRCRGQLHGPGPPRGLRGPALREAAFRLGAHTRQCGQAAPPRRASSWVLSGWRRAEGGWPGADSHPRARESGTRRHTASRLLGPPSAQSPPAWEEPLMDDHLQRWPVGTARVINPRGHTSPRALGVRADPRKHRPAVS